MEYLFEVGPLSSDRGQISCAELIAWQDGTGLNLTGWEFTSIRHLSRVISGSVKSFSETDLSSPYSEEKDEDVIGKKVVEILETLGDGRC